MVEVWREGGRRKEGRKEGRTALIKSNNPHLAGDGECFNAMVGITRSKVILSPNEQPPPSSFSMLGASVHFSQNRAGALRPQKQKRTGTFSIVPLIFGKP